MSPVSCWQYSWAMLVILSSVPTFGCRFEPSENGENKITYQHFPNLGYYHITYVAFEWGNGYQFCKDNDGYMGIVNSDAEAEVFMELIARTGYSNATIGFHDMFTDGEYITVLGDPISRTGYTRWELEEPSGYDTRFYDCGGFSLNGGLVTLNCSEPYPVICEQHRWVDYEYIPEVDGYYKFHFEPMTWPEARATCQYEESHLLILNSEAEYDAMQNLLSRYPEFPEADNDNLVLVGAHHVYCRNLYLTVFDEPLNNTGFSRWAEGEPSGGSSFPYVSLKRGDAFFLTSPMYRVPFICEHSFD